MEFNLPNYRPNKYPNEVPVYLKLLKNLFQTRTVYVFGYGSLAYADGWNGRNMKHPPLEDDLIECTLDNYEKGPWAIYGRTNFYGLLQRPNKQVVGVLARVHTLGDWYNLMYTEYAAGIHENYTYRVVDITDSITGLDSKLNLEDDATIHTVRCAPTDRYKARTTIPYMNYYKRTWRGVSLNRSPKFVKHFIATNGFKNDDEAEYFINN